ncbi:MAG: dTDP-4-amino-4,6-dideoxygalactose transaminase [Bacteroidetes bacterium]|nr:dTDP-4-amino-4,6-dideoxygalactose transaminase [Bacteroidota bacterium]
MINFNKPYFTGQESVYMHEAMALGKISGGGVFTKKCHQFFQEKYGFKKVMLTTSCTSALEMAAILLIIKEGDEVIVPSYTFVSTVNAFVLRGAKIVFVDSSMNSPNMDADKIEALITTKTKVIVPVHYAGIACDMDKIMELANVHNIFVVEDAAHSIDAYYKNKPLGSIGHLAAFSFHETKNITSGEGGLLVINDPQFIERAQIIGDMGTNRFAFYKGEINKYEWVDVGSSFFPSDMIAAFLYAQLQNIDDIQNKRKQIWEHYYDGLKDLQEAGKLTLPKMFSYASNNGHMFYILCRNLTERGRLMEYLKMNGISSVFHYSSLHKSPYFRDRHTGMDLPMSDIYSNTLLRLPFYYDLKEEEIKHVVDKVYSFFSEN